MVILNVIRAKMYIDLFEQLPKCEHGFNLMDWGYNVLEPPCGCKIIPDIKQSEVEVSET